MSRCGYFLSLILLSCLFLIGVVIGEYMIPILYKHPGRTVHRAYREGIKYCMGIYVHVLSFVCAIKSDFFVQWRRCFFCIVKEGKEY